MDVNETQAPKEPWLLCGGYFARTAGLSNKGRIAYET
jgi:hypothetical protein